MTGPDASSDEMPGFPLPGRLGRERDEPALDMILDGLSPPADAPLQLRGLSQLLAHLAAPAGPGELTAEAEVLSGFRRCVAAAGASRVVRRPVRRRSTRRLAPDRTGPVVAAAGLGGTAGAYAGVMPGPVQDFAHHAIARPRPATFPVTRPASHPPRRLPASRRRSQPSPDGEGITPRSGTEPARPGQPCRLGTGTRASSAPTRASQPVPRPSQPGPGNGRPSPRSAPRRPDAGAPARHGTRRMPELTVPPRAPPRR